MEEDLPDLFKVIALYCFVPIEDTEQVESFLRETCATHGIKGNLIVAKEGINGTVAGLVSKSDAFILQIQEDPRFIAMEIKFSYAKEQPFYHMRVHCKPEIVTMGVPEIDPSSGKGIYVEPEDWNDLISDPSTILIDTRNDYEVKIGKFKGAKDPLTKTFREFPAYVDREISDLASPFPSPPAVSESDEATESKPEQKTKIAMYCTGGIRCEKATALLKAKGFDEVYHLKGGILKYLERVPQETSLWEGECYVFDQRVSVTHGVQPGSYSQCRGCRMPLSAEDVDEEKYPGSFLEGVHCRYCIDSLTEKKREAAIQRQRQIDLAAERNMSHLGYQLPSKEERKRKRELKKMRGRKRDDDDRDRGDIDTVDASSLLVHEKQQASS